MNLQKSTPHLLVLFFFFHFFAPDCKGQNSGLVVSVPELKDIRNIIFTCENPASKYALTKILDTLQGIDRWREDVVNGQITVITNLPIVDFRFITEQCATYSLHVRQAGIPLKLVAERIVSNDPRLIIYEKGKDNSQNPPTVIFISQREFNQMTKKKKQVILANPEKYKVK